MKRVVEFFRTRFQNFNLFTRRHRTAVVGVSSLLIVSLVVQQTFFNKVPEAQAALTNVRQEINIIDGYLSAASGAYATSSEVINIDTTKYNGATYYLEVVGTTTSATNATVSLVGASSGATAVSVTMNGTSYDRYRSASFSLTTGDYRVRVNNEAVGKGLIAARIVILQNSGSITSTQTQIEIGARQTYTSGTMSGLSQPKYWKYNSSNWDGSPTFYAEVTYGRVTDVNVASSTTYSTSGSFNFTVPSNIASSTVVQLWGGGGAGGGAVTNNNGAGSGGAGGQYARKVITGLAGQTKTVVVGTGGTGGTGTGGTGNDSTWDTNVVVAKGGAGGAADSGAAGTGSTANGVGDVVNAGGNGAAGVSAGSSGGGGEGGRSTGTGGNATGGTGGTGGDGGDGGAGSAADTNPGNPGNAPGGGGAGARSTGNPNRNGGAGAIGRAVISYNIGANATTTIVLQESDGTGDGFAGWTTKATIVSGGSASTPTRVRSSSFTPTAGRNYRIAVQEGYNGATHAVYNAKIIVDQTNPTKLEPQYLLANKILASGTGLQKYHTYFDTAEWTNAINTYTHQVDAANGSASVAEVTTEAGTQVTGSVVTSPDNSGVSSSMTMPSTGDLDMRATTNNGDVYASRILVAVTPDITAPTPNPYFATAPNATTTNMVNMTSVTITDANTVSYFFDSVTGGCGGNAGTGGTDSGWQSSPIYYDTGLDVNKCYAYQVTGKDGANNVTSTSTASTTYTRAATPGGMAYVNGQVTVTSIRLSNTENSNPASNPTTQFVVLASTTDSNWNGFYLTGTTPATSTTPTWMSDATIDAITLTGLKQNRLYEFSVVARNQNQILTATSTRTGTTTRPDVTTPTPNPMTFASAPNDVSNSEISMTSTTGTDDTGPVSYNFTYTTCGVNPGTGGTGSGWQTSTSYSDTGLEVNKCYGYTVQARDSLSNTGTASAASEAYTAANTPSAPTLGSAGETTFGITINANGNPSNTEYAVHFATPSPDDTDWNNKFLDTDGTPSDTAVWMTKATIDAITVNGLKFATTYYVEVKARNGDNEETSYSSQASVTTTADLTAPTPNPTFASAPSNDSDTQISMITNFVSDPTTPVEYLFTAVTGSCGANLGTGGTSSSWQTSTSYSDNGLQANKCYGYTVTARDGNANTTSASAASVTYTSAAVPGAPTQVSVSDESLVLSNNANGNPSSNPITYFAIQVSVTSDGTWLNQYADASGNPSGSAVWLTNAQLTNFTVQGLQPTTSYTFRVKARNQDNDETAFGSTATFTTSNPIFPVTRLQGGVRLQGLRVY